MAGNRAFLISFGVLALLVCGCIKLGESSELRTAVEPTPVPGDRISCLEIFGTAFRSVAERDWFMENCSKWPLVKVGDEAPAAPGAAAPQQASEPPECAAIRGKPYESNQQRTWYLQNCNQSGAPVPPAAAAPPQPASGPDRADCNAIRGTPYRSNAERTWYIQNCSSNQPPPNQAPAAAGPDRADCNAIRGTTYRSSAERDWYLANCQG